MGDDELGVEEFRELEMDFLKWNKLYIIHLKIVSPFLFEGT